MMMAAELALLVEDLQKMDRKHWKVLEYDKVAAAALSPDNDGAHLLERLVEFLGWPKLADPKGAAVRVLGPWHQSKHDHSTNSIGASPAQIEHLEQLDSALGVTDWKLLFQDAQQLFPGGKPREAPEGGVDAFWKKGWAK